MEDQYCIMSKALKRGGLRWELFDDVEEELAPPSLLVRLDDLVPKVNVPTARDDLLSVDCFLDFPAGGEEEEGKDSVSESSYVEDNASNISGAGSFFSSELAVPEDDLAELEWVSHFVDDSSCDVSFVVPSSMEVTKARVNRFDPTHVSSGFEGARGTSILFPCPVPAKVRTKRQRPTRLSRTWSSGTGSLPLSPAVSSSVSPPCLIVNEGPVQPVQSGIGSNEPVQKKAKKGHPGQTNVGETGLAQFQRRCTHCQVQKTPQWRAGPLGPKTLCNACGVRYKSGRLFPEYRPAGSPTFSSEVHSNSHRKVLEMRRQNEAGEMAKFSQMIQSF